MDTDTLPSEPELDKLWELIKSIRFGMLTTRHANGHLHARPMTTQNRALDTPQLHFFASRSTEPVIDADAQPQVNVSYADPGQDRYVSVSGRARIVDDPQQKQRLWNTAAEAWFPYGPQDPDVALLEVEIEHAEYWDVKSSKPVQLYRMARAVLTGTTPELDADYGEIRLRPEGRGS